MERQSKSSICVLLVISAFISSTCQTATAIDDDHQTGETAWPATFEIGRAATVDEILNLDIDVRPDGRGLPAGSGNFELGKMVYEQKCSLCHGKNGTEGPYNKLVHVENPEKENQEKTIGNYWPYASTLFDYINRAMPYDKPGTLTADEVYSVTAFLLARNNLIDPTITLDSSNLWKVHLPAHSLFVVDDREETNTIR